MYAAKSVMVKTKVTFSDVMPAPGYISHLRQRPTQCDNVWVDVRGVVEPAMVQLIGVQVEVESKMKKVMMKKVRKL